MSNADARAHDVVAEEARASARPSIARREPLPRQRILAPQVHVAVLAARRVAGDRHRLDEGERVVLDHDPVLERPGLRLVGVAHEVVRPDRVSGHGVPLAAGRERGAAAAEEPRVGHLADDAGRADVDAPGGARRSRRRRGSCRGSPGRPGRSGAGAGGAGRRPAARAAAEDPATRRAASAAAMSAARAGAISCSAACSPAWVTSAAGARSHIPRHGLSSQIERAVPGVLARRADRALELLDELGAAAAHAGDVGADVGDERRARLEREEGVEARHPVRLRRRDREPAAHVRRGRRG